MVQVSIILPAYNEERYIGPCIRSLLLQDFADFELLIVDDGSTDKTLEIARRFAVGNKKIKIFMQNHSGPGEARNFAAKKSKGTILIFADSDEEYPPEYVSKLIAPIKKRLSIGSIQKYKKLNPSSNIFSTLKFAEFKSRFNYIDGTGTTIFRAIRKSAFLKTGFDTTSDYFDDASLSMRIGKAPLLVDTFSYATYSSTPSEIVLDSAWGVKSSINSGNKRPIILGAVFIAVILLLIWLGYIGACLFIIAVIALAAYGYKVSGKLSGAAVYPLFFFFKMIGLYLGVYRGLFRKDYKGK